MDNALLNNINNLVGRTDELWILGDFCFCRREKNYREAVQQYRGRIRCRNTNIVLGNHDRPAIGDFFQRTCELTTEKIDGRKVVLSHYPFAIWNARHFGSIDLYGHSHGRAEPWLDEIMPGRFSMDVGVDNAHKLMGEYRPFTFGEIRGIMEKRSGFGLLKADRADDLQAAGQNRTP
jgi:calcineurin-like phosphoesterase family protein